MNKTTIYCFRNDLRLSDNPALKESIKSKLPILLCYIFDDHSPKQWRIGRASRWWLHHSLNSLQQKIQSLGGKLILRSGIWHEQIVKIAKETQTTEVFCQRSYLPHEIEQENKARTSLLNLGAKLKRFNSYLLYEPEEIQTKAGTPFKVFTPFWNACLNQSDTQLPLNPPKKIDFSSIKIKSDPLQSWNLLPTNPDWSTGISNSWTPGEIGAQKRLKEFLKKSTEYKNQRDLPASEATSKLSPHLHFGEISPRQIWHQINKRIITDPSATKGAESFLRQLGWRDFANHLIFHWPDLPTQPFKKEFKKFKWKNKTKKLNAWQKGLTGYPLVDAGMRQLWETGWMHNRVRMIAASLLIKNTLQPWQIGEQWFWDTLVDADLAINAASWQWVAGSGSDAAPYFRIFNPVIQSKKFDPQGQYIRKWIPELKHLSNKSIHTPWLASKNELDNAKITLGKNYPKPIIDLKFSRDKALQEYKKIKNNK